MSYIDRIPAPEREAAFAGADRIIAAMVALSGAVFTAVVKSMRADSSITLNKMAEILAPKGVVGDDPRGELAELLATLWLFDGKQLADGLGDVEPWLSIREAVAAYLAAFDESGCPRPLR